MAKPTTAQKLLTYVLLAPLIVASTAFFGIISLITSLWDKGGRQQHAIAQVWAKSLLMLAFSPMTIIGREKLGRVGVYASNHISYMDTPALFGNLPFQFRILANHYLFKIPFIGWHLTRSGQVPIDGDPIDTTGLTTRDAEAVTKKLHDAIAEMYYAHSDVQRPAKEEPAVSAELA
ncbi:lysophospholipid acyltransferase family protein [Terriglobus sp. YAF25]|uniref:lysophospholipid acyltransferase family protein n=1 Tax=Terriglobus sp. YAF25 TaxID=3233080 RepID=UPI003F9C5AA5